MTSNPFFCLTQVDLEMMPDDGPTCRHFKNGMNIGRRKDETYTTVIWSHVCTFYTSYFETLNKLTFTLMVQILALKLSSMRAQIELQPHTSLYRWIA